MLPKSSGTKCGYLVYQVGSLTMSCVCVHILVWCVHCVSLGFCFCWLDIVCFCWHFVNTFNLVCVSPSGDYPAPPQHAPVWNPPAAVDVPAVLIQESPLHGCLLRLTWPPPLYTNSLFTQSSFYTKQLLMRSPLHQDVFTIRAFYAKQTVQTGAWQL